MVRIINSEVKIDRVLYTRRCFVQSTKAFVAALDDNSQTVQITHIPGLNPMTYNPQPLINRVVIIMSNGNGRKEPRRIFHALLLNIYIRVKSLALCIVSYCAEW